MPIYHKTPPPSTVGNHNTAEIDYHTSEAAKVKRTREQAYFNSYDFDAIEVLPYDDEEDEDGAGKGKGNANQREKEQRQLKSINARQQLNKLPQQLTIHHHQQQHQTQQHQQHHQQWQQQQQQQQTSNHTLKAVSSSCNSFMVDNCQQHSHPLHHVNSKLNPSICFQRISSIFTSKTNNKPPLNQHKQQQQLQHNQCKNDGCVGGGDNNNISVAINASSHDNKHLKLSSSKTSSTTLSPASSSSSTIVKKIFNAGNVGSDVIATSSGLLPPECARHVTGTRTRTNDIASINVKAIGMVTCTSATTTTTTPITAGIATSTKAAGNSGNFLLPRAMLKYQSSTLNTPQGATGTPAGNTNSMPLASLPPAATSSRSSNTTPTNISRQQKQQQLLNTLKNVHKLDDIKGNNAMIPSNSSKTGLRLKKTSTSSSLITSITSEDIEEEEEDRDLEENEDEHESQLKAVETVLPQTLNTKITARASSHQSHYSTDKSASSGYYSSNVCSTYSLEEHIYSEPTLDLKKLKNNAKEIKQPPANTQLSSSAAATATATATPSAAAGATLSTNNNKLPQHQQQSSNFLAATTKETDSVMRSLDVNTCYRYAENGLQTLPSNRNSQEFSENLKILESSIENLDRHLKSFPAVNSPEALVNYAQIPYSNSYVSANHNDKLRAASSYHQLPTIQESLDAVKKQSWQEDRSDDSLRDIDLDSFLLDKDKKVGSKSKKALNNKSKGVDNPTFLTEEQEENHYKCAKYINSCPEDAYRVESDIIAPARSSISEQSLAVSVDLYPKRYEDQLHFQNTRELLEDVRDKIRLLTQTQKAEKQHCQPASAEEEDEEEEGDKEECIPKELHNMINTLKHELELYLDRMNQHSELEIRQLCTGLVKNQHIVKMKNAFERRRSLSEATDIYSTYEAVQDGIVMNAQGVPISIRKEITSIRCTSDPNFKMKRKAITEVFPMAECYVETLHTLHNSISATKPLNKVSQLQRNLSYHKPVLEQLHPSNTNTKLKGNSSSSNNNNNNGSSSGNASSGDTSEPTDKESILDWHRKKPSIWEMYYGTNRIQQSLLGDKRNGMMVTTASTGSPSTMCYPSSRPESDFTLDLPRAEQLRIKMEKEKKFRQRCRVITTFLSLVFFLLTVMVVSLVLTRGKRMFGSMI